MTSLTIQKRIGDRDDESYLVDYYWGEVDEVVQRIINYLGDKLKIIRYLQSVDASGMPKWYRTNGYKNLDPKRNPQSTMELYNLVIEFES